MSAIRDETTWAPALEPDVDAGVCGTSLGVRTLSDVEEEMCSERPA